MSLVRSPPSTAPAAARVALVLAAVGALTAPVARAQDLTLAGRAAVRVEPDPWARVLTVLEAGDTVALRSAPVGGPWVPVTVAASPGYVAGRREGDALVADERLVASARLAGEAVRVHVATPLRSAPALGREPVALLPPGAVLSVRSQVGTWLEVAGTGGLSGWFDVFASIVSSATAADLAAADLAAAALPGDAAGEAPARKAPKAPKAAKAGKAGSETAGSGSGATGQEEKAGGAEETRETKDAEKAAKAAREADERRAKEVAKDADAAAKAARAEEERRGKQAEKDAREAEKDAREAAKAAREARGDDRRAPEAAPAPAPAATAAGPAEPVEIAPAVPVTLPSKSPAERKVDPARSPLVGAALPAPSGTTGPGLEVASDYRPYDPEAQLERSIEAARGSPGTPAGRAGADWVDAQGRAVPTRVVAEVVARVNDEIVTSVDFLQRLGDERERLRRESPELASRVTDDELRAQVLARMIEELLLIDEARAIGVPTERVYEQAKAEFMQQAGIPDDLELLRLLDATGRSWDDFRRELVRRRLPHVVIYSRVLSRIVVPEEEIEDYYRRHQSDWASEDCVRLRELVLLPEPSETTRDFNQRLQDLLQRVERGEDFCDLARRHSQAPSASACGLLEQCFTFEQLDQKAARIAFKMRPGDVEPVRTEWGYHVLVLEEHRPRQVPGVQDVREEILRVLRRDLQRDAVREYIDKLRQAARVVVSPDYERFYDQGLRGGIEGASGQ